MVSVRRKRFVEIKYNEKIIFVFRKGLHGGGKMSTLARSNASLYGTKDDLYDRLKRHAYTGKKGKLKSEIHKRNGN